MEKFHPPSKNRSLDTQRVDLCKKVEIITSLQIGNKNVPIGPGLKEGALPSLRFIQSS